MADLALVDTATVPGGTEQKIVAGEALVAGTPIYKKAADKKAYKADANATVDTANCIGVTTNNAAAGQTVSYLPNGNDITVSAVMTVGVVYAVSAAAGKICPVADLVSGCWVTILGVAKTTSLLPLRINATGVQIP